MKVGHSVAAALVVASLCVAAGAGLASAQSPAPATGRPAVPPASEPDDQASMEQINKQLNNPVSSLWSLNFQHNFVFSEGPPSERERWYYNFNFQPVLPIRLTEDWNLISRPVIPVLAGVDVPELSGGGLNWTEKSGFGDIVFFSLLSPNSAQGLLWGVGPAFIFPTASDDALGQGKWQSGPAAGGRRPLPGEGVDLRRPRPAVVVLCRR